MKHSQTSYIELRKFKSKNQNSNTNNCYVSNVRSLKQDKITTVLAYKIKTFDSIKRIKGF